MAGQAIAAFDPNAEAELPAPARRLLTAAVPTGIQLPRVVELEMRGEIKLRRWIPFTAQQIICVGSGFVWRARAGRVPLVFTGGDVLVGADASLEFRWWRMIPVVRAAGPDVARSAAGRLAAETAAWAPQGLTPGAGTTWTALDDRRGKATVLVAGRPVDITVSVNTDGELEEVAMLRWGDPEGGRFAMHPFGGTLEGTMDCAGIRIARTGRIGWHWGTKRSAEGEFFRFEITAARPAG